MAEFELHEEHIIKEIKKLMIIPAHNEQDSIVSTMEDVYNHCPDWDAVVINDGSSDKTLDICKENGYKCLNLSSNLGLSGAFQTGMMFAYEKGYDFVIQFDGDGQHQACYVSELLKIAIQENSDITVGSRFVKSKKPFSARMLGSRLITLAIFITTGKLLTDPTSGMRLFNRKMICVLAKNINCHPEPDTIAHLLRNKAVLKEVQIEMSERKAGVSYLNIFNGIGYTMITFVSIFFIQWFRRGINR